MFSYMSVCHSVHRRSHVTIIRDALALTEQDHPAHGTSGTPKAPPTPDMGPQRLPASDIWWPPLKTCSKLFTLRPTPPNRSCNLMAVEAGTVSTSGWYASYWNAFLCTVRPRYVTQMSIPFVYVAFLYVTFGERFSSFPVGTN